MISEAIAKKYVAKLSSLNFFAERGVEGVRVLKETLMDCANSEAHAKAIIDTALDGHGCPEPADLRRIAYQLNEPAWTADDEPTGKCGCDHGFLHVDIIRDCGCGRQRYSCAKPCPRCNPNWGGGKAA